MMKAVPPSPLSSPGRSSLPSVAADHAKGVLPPLIGLKDAVTDPQRG
ncbi:hypothetical protein LJR078_000018 [Arthrobacter sp. LjRoot78]